jgi:hypothetical protein
MLLPLAPRSSEEEAPRGGGWGEMGGKGEGLGATGRSGLRSLVYGLWLCGGGR